MMLHMENERGYAAVNDLGVLCGRDAMEDEDGCAAEIGEMAIEAMMVVARKWGFDTVTLTHGGGRVEAVPTEHREAGERTEDARVIGGPDAHGGVHEEGE